MMKFPIANQGRGVELMRAMTSVCRRGKCQMSPMKAKPAGSLECVRWQSGLDCQATIEHGSEIA